MSDPNDRPPVQTIDLGFLGIAEAIAVYALTGPSGTVLVECGPMTTLPGLLSSLETLQIAPSDVTDVLLTHVHLDHAGAAGWWAAQGARIHVHPRGYRHLLDPARLLASAARVWESDMERFWGDMPPVPEERLTAHQDGELIRAGGLAFVCLETPGHARHHLCYAVGDTVFTGDVAGIRLPGHLAAVAPTPPPDIDVDAWLHSLERISALRPSRLFLTHFGEVRDPDAHLTRVAASLRASVVQVAEGIARGLDRAALATEFEAWSRKQLVAQGVTGPALEAYIAGIPAPMAVDGLTLWLGRDEADSARSGDPGAGSVIQEPR